MSNVTDDIRANIAGQTLVNGKANVHKWLRAGIRRQHFKLEKENEMPAFTQSSVIQQLQAAKRQDVIDVATTINSDINAATNMTALLAAFDVVVPWIE